MNHVLYSVPTAALFAFALVSASVPATQEPKEAGSTTKMNPPGFQDGALDPCVQQWDEMLRLFDRGDKEQIRQRLCEDGAALKKDSDPNNPANPNKPGEPNKAADPNRPAAALHTGAKSSCIASSAVAFIEGAQENDSSTVTGPDAIVDRLCSVWPALTKAENDAANRSKVTKSYVLDEGNDRKIYLLTIERPATAKNDAKTTFMVSAIVCGQPYSANAPGAPDPARRAEDPSRAGGGADSSAWSKQQRGGGKLVHLHVSSAN